VRFPEPCRRASSEVVVGICSLLSSQRTSHAFIAEPNTASQLERTDGCDLSHQYRSWQPRAGAAHRSGIM
jgi:hypothetical protein